MHITKHQFRQNVQFITSLKTQKCENAQNEKGEKHKM